MKFRLLLLTLLLTSIFRLNPSSADESPYSFTGACGSVGSWTQNAMAQASILKGTLEKLQHITGCETIASLGKDVEGQMPNTVPAEAEVGAVESAPARESALTTAADQGDDNFHSNLIKAMIQTKLNLGVATAESSLTQAALQGLTPINGINRNRSMQNASSLVEQIARTLTLPSYNSSTGCLHNHADIAAEALVDTVTLAAHFIAGGNVMSTGLNSALKSLITMLQDQTYLRALKTINKPLFWNSMSCVIEATTESYCSVEDANHLLDKDYLNLKVQKAKDNSATFGDPLAGFYALSLHIPHIAQWIQQVQFGIEPQWITDSDFKKSALENTTNYQSTGWAILGQFNDKKKVFSRFKDTQSKRLFLLQMLSTIYSELVGRASSVDYSQLSAGGDLNFYTMSVQVAYIPFFLIGEPLIPDEAVRNQMGGLPLPWDEYMKGNGSFEKVPQFQDPDRLIVTVEQRLRELIAMANIKASEFYQDRIIVNQPNLVAKAVVDPQYTVRQSFEFLYDYLGKVDEMFRRDVKEYKGDTEERHIIELIALTRSNLNAVLQAFDVLASLGTYRPQSQEDRDFIETQYHNVVKTVYKKFDLMYQRDSFLTNAIIPVVKADYIYRMNHDIGFGKYETDLITSMGQDFVDFLLTSVHGVDPAKIQADLSRATAITYHGTLEAVDQSFGDSIKAAIDEINMMISGGDTRDSELRSRSMRRLWEDTFSNGVFQRDTPWASRIAELGGFWTMLLAQNHYRPNLYQFPTDNGLARVRNVDTPFDALRNLRDQLCIQSLAFLYNKDFARVCKDVILSFKPYKDQSPNFDLNANYESLLNLPHDSQHVDDQICAYRNFRRRNYVFWLTQNVKKGVHTNPQ